jgi:hypothetical protein
MMAKKKKALTKGRKCMHLWMCYNKEERKRVSMLWKEEGDSVEGKECAHPWTRYNREERESFNIREREKEIWSRGKKNNFNVMEKESNGQGKRELWQMGKSVHTLRCVATKRRKKNNGG